MFNSYEGSVANVASGNYSHAEGQRTTASGFCSHTEGGSTTASGSYSHAEGGGATAEGTSSHAEGNNTTASGHYSHAEGDTTRALNLYEHAEGRYNVSNTGDTEDLQTRHSVGIGTSSLSDRKNAHEIMANGDHYIYGLGGYNGTNANTAQTLQEVINSKQTITDAVGKIDSTSDGTGEIFNSYTGAIANEASGSASHAEGSNTTASASGAHAEGYNTTASGNYSHAEGYTTTASGNDSHSEGNRSTASGAYSHAEGDHTEAFGSSEHSEGKYNKSYKSTSASVRVIHSVGIGSAESDRKNAHEIKINGDHYIYGLGNFDGTNSADAQTLQEVINNKADSTLLPTYTTAPTLIADYNIPANATTVEKVYDITVGDTLFNITYDTSIKWVNNVAPITRVNHRYVVSVINNLGVWGEF